MQYHVSVISSVIIPETMEYWVVALLLIAIICIAATLFTLGHCIYHYENQDRLSYVLMILLLPVAGLVLYWKNRPDIFNVGITMAYPTHEEKESKAREAKARKPSGDKYSSPPMPAEPAKQPRYSSPPFEPVAKKQKSRTSSPPAHPDTPDSDSDYLVQI